MGTVGASVELYGDLDLPDVLQRSDPMEDPKTMEDSPKWELIYEDSSKQDVTDRLHVDGGYLYRTRVMAGATTSASGQVAVAVAFVPEKLF